MRITYDSKAKAVYIYLTDNPVDMGDKALLVSTQEIGDNVRVDIDDNANIVGIEILGATPITVEAL